MDRRNFTSVFLTAGLSSFISFRSLENIILSGQGSQSGNMTFDDYDIIPAPYDPKLWEEWRNALQNWRKRKQSLLKYDGSSYLSDPFKWVSSDYSCCFIMTCDSDFYDYKKNEYRISQLIDRGKNEYGGYDSVVLWHAYPRIGLDDRNQFDFYREMPHGLPGVRDVVKQFHDAGIKVFIDYNPWDKGTRREQKPDIDLLIDMLRSIDADGIFLDTMKDAPDFRKMLDSVKEGIVLEGEIALPLEHIQTHHMSWAQWFEDSHAPGVYRNKWFERHHMQHAIHRWNGNRSTQLQTAWMNGSGMLIWENVFGQLLGWSERDKSIYRAMHNIQHQFSSLFSGEEWRPLSNISPAGNVYISSWKSEGVRLWTMINRNDTPVSGVLFKTSVLNKYRLFDLLKGEEISGITDSGYISVRGRIGGRGIGCFLAISEDKIDSGFTGFLTEQKRIYKAASESILVPVANNMVLRQNNPARHASIPDGMVTVAPASLTLTVEYTFREPGGYGNIQDHLKLAVDHKLHSVCRIERKADIKRFAIDETPVTNSQFKMFLDKSGYKPFIPYNFLRHWTNGTIPPGKDEHPVVYIDLIDARAYAKWAGKRLPSEEEWQYAAQGPEALDYPWGNKPGPDRCNQATDGSTTAVRDFPGGISPFGCLDMCGNTWELTGNEYSDGRTRFVMLKGGSCYKAEGSEWYFDGGPQKNCFVAKMLLIWPGLDRCSTVGFRCAADLISSD